MFGFSECFVYSQSVQSSNLKKVVKTNCTCTRSDPWILFYVTNKKHYLNYILCNSYLFSTGASRWAISINQSRINYLKLFHPYYINSNKLFILVLYKLTFYFDSGLRTCISTFIYILKFYLRLIIILQNQLGNIP